MSGWINLRQAIHQLSSTTTRHHSAADYSNVTTYLLLLLLLFLSLIFCEVANMLPNDLCSL